MRFILKLLKIKTHPVEKVLDMVKLTQNAKKQFYKMIISGACRIFVVRLFGKTAGAVYLFTELEDKEIADGKNVCYISNLYVQPKFRGKGLGTRMLEYTFEYARELGFKQATIGVYEKEERNVKLYKRMGFTKELKRLSKDVVLKDENGNQISLDEYMILVKEF